MNPESSTRSTKGMHNSRLLLPSSGPRGHHELPEFLLIDSSRWLAFDASVEEAERMLLTQFFEHEHRFSPAVKIGCDEYHIPEHIVPHIDYITPGIKLSNRVVKRSIKVAKTTTERNSRKSPIWGFGRGRHERPSSTTAAGLPLDLRDCAATMTPTCHRALYQIPDPVKVSTGNSLGVFEQGCYFA